MLRRRRSAREAATAEEKGGAPEEPSLDENTLLLASSPPPPLEKNGAGSRSRALLFEEAASAPPFVGEYSSCFAVSSTLKAVSTHAWLWSPSPPPLGPPPTLPLRAAARTDETARGEERLKVLCPPNAAPFPNRSSNAGVAAKAVAPAPLLPPPPPPPLLFAALERLRLRPIEAFESIVHAMC